MDQGWFENRDGLSDSTSWDGRGRMRAWRLGSKQSKKCSVLGTSRFWWASPARLASTTYAAINSGGQKSRRLGNDGLASSALGVACHWSGCDFRDALRICSSEYRARTKDAHRSAATCRGGVAGPSKACRPHCSKGVPKGAVRESARNSEGTPSSAAKLVEARQGEARRAYYGLGRWIARQWRRVWNGISAAVQRYGLGGPRSAICSWVSRPVWDGLQGCADHGAAKGGLSHHEA